MQTMSHAKLARIQEHARKNTKFYSKFSSDFPVLSKANLYQFQTDLMSESYVGYAFKGVTSGSTGTPLTFYQDSLHHAWSEACRDRAHAWWGIQRGARTFILWGRPVVGGTWVQAKSWLKYRLRNSLSFNTFQDLTDEYLGQIYRGLIRFKPELIYGYGSSIGALALWMDKRGIQMPAWQGLKLVEYTGDHMLPFEKEVAERVFGVPVASLYASSEASGLAYQCPAGNLHISSDHIWVEFLREDDSPANPDEPARIVVTTLNNFVMPLIRYEVGDIGSYSSKICSCGVILPVMNLEVGKLVNQITTSTKKAVSSYVLDYIAKHITREKMPGIRLFQVLQTGLDDFVLKIVRSEEYSDQTINFFIQKMREYLGKQIQVQVEFVSEIQVSKSGKRSWFHKAL
jgi:phenylacetate-CoA ligase